MRKVLSLLISFILVITVSSPVFAATKTELQQKKQEAQEQKQEVQEQKSEAMDEIKKLSDSISENETKLEDLSDELKSLNNDISKLQTELKETQKRYDSQEKLLQDRISAQYEAGETTFLDVILSSSSFSDFLSNYFLVSEILENDSDLLTSIDNQKTKIEKSKEDLENKQKAVKTKKAEQEKMQVVLNNQKAEKQNKVSSLSAEEKKLSAQIDEYNKALQQLEAAARRVSRVSYTSNTKYVGGKMLWPCPSSTRITSTFGGRSSPGGIGSTNHKGIDIGASSGSAIVAALDGKVVYTGYNVARGNYVMIDHGGGIITLYQHGLSGSTRVSSGQTVKQGQTIMGVGSTGYSTGPHLHFEVWENGTPVNPIKYVTG